MSRDAYYSRPEGQSVPYFVNGQYYYNYTLVYYRDTTDHRFLGELYNRRHELFHKIFPDSRADFRTALGGVLDKARSKRRTRSGTMQRSLNIGSPRVRCWGLVGDGDEDLRLEWFKVKTVDLQDEEVGDVVRGGGGGQGGPVVTTITAYSKR